MLTVEGGIPEEVKVALTPDDQDEGAIWIVPLTEEEAMEKAMEMLGESVRKRRSSSSRMRMFLIFGSVRAQSCSILQSRSLILGQDRNRRGHEDICLEESVFKQASTFCSPEALQWC
jgi:hypothetical protein